MIQCEEILYLACPYSDPNPDVSAARANTASWTAGQLMQQGLVVFSPISHGHAIQEQVNLPTDFAYWKRSCEAFVTACEVFAVLTLPGWRESKGVTVELSLARKLGKRVAFIDVSGNEVAIDCNVTALVETVLLPFQTIVLTD